MWRQLEDKSKGLSRMKYNALREEGTPAASTYIRRYGSWSAACDLAGVTSSKARRSNYVQDWSDEDILAAVNEYIDTTGNTVYHDYTAWAREHGRPSGPLLITRFGSWAKARKEAIKHQAAAVA